MKCELCHNEFHEDDPHIFLCESCRAKPKACQCGSENKYFGWDIIFDHNGEIKWDIVWIVRCDDCERTTSNTASPQEALDEWENK